MVFFVMLSGYGLNSQLTEVPWAIKASLDTENTQGSFQSDSDSQEDENFKYSSPVICVYGNTSTSFATLNPSVFKFNSFDVWQPPKSC